MNKMWGFFLNLLLLCVSSGSVAQQRGAVGVKSMPNLPNLQPGRYDSTWWNRAPYRLIQTNLREIDAGMDITAYVQSMIDVSASVVLINVGGIVANYPTTLPFHYKNPYLKGDLVGELIQQLHAKGIKVIGRFDFSKLNETLAAQRPEWLYVSVAGKNVNYNGQVHTCINGEYQQEYSLKILEEAIRAYPLDGVFFNMIGYTTSDYSGTHHGICQCHNCRERFLDSTGFALPRKSDPTDSVFRSYAAFKKTTSDELFHRIRHRIKSLNPKLLINTYTDAGVDMIASESSADIASPMEWNYSATDNVKRVLGSYSDRSPGNLLINFQAIGFRHVGVSPHLAKVWMLQSLLHGAPLGFVVIGPLNNYEDQSFIPVLKDLYGFHKKYEKLFTNLRSVSKIALVKGSNAEYQGMIKLLSEEHLPYDIIEAAAIGKGHLPRELSEYKVLILADVSNMSPDLVAAIDRYVENGGKILTTGFPSTNDALGTPLHRIRLQALGVRPDYTFFERSKSTYLSVDVRDKKALGEAAFSDFRLVMLYSDFLKCRPVPAAVTYLRLLPQTRFGPPEKMYYGESDLTDHPGIIYHQHGKGQSVFMPWLLGSQYGLKGHHTHRALFKAALQGLLKEEGQLETNAPALIEISHLSNRKQAFEWVGFINHSGQIGGSYREAIPVLDTRLRFKPAAKVKTLHLLKAGTAVPFKQVNGWLECIVPRVDDFELLLCTYEP